MSHILFCIWWPILWYAIGFGAAYLYLKFFPKKKRGK